jgi:tight adherence protein B
MTGSSIKAVILVCIFGAVVLAIEGLLRWFSEGRASERAINMRLKLIGEGRTRGEALSLLRQQRTYLATIAPPSLRSIATRFDRMVTAARLGIPATRLFAIVALLPLVLFILLLVFVIGSGIALGFGRILLLITFAFVLGVGLPMTILRMKAASVRRRMQEQFPVALDVFVRGLRAGHPIAAALDLLTVEMPDPIGTELGTVIDEVTYGADLRDALADLADRWDMEDMRMFVVSLAIQSETGGNLAEILENLARVIRERASMMMKVRALSSEGRMTAVMLTGLPVFAFVLLFLIRPGFYLDVAGDPAFLPGFATLLILYAIGFYTIRRLVDLKV